MKKVYKRGKLWYFSVAGVEVGPHNSKEEAEKALEEDDKREREANEAFARRLQKAIEERK